MVFAITGCIAAEIPHQAEHHPDSAVESYLRDKLALWKQRLNLDAWAVSVVVAGQSDLRPGTLGNVHWDADKKTAVIRVLDSTGNQFNGQLPAADALRDMECTIVHELIHLELANLPKTDESRAPEEGVVNNLATALLQLARKDTPVQTSR